MHISQIKLDSRAADPKHVQRQLGGGYRLHQALWRLFGDAPDAQRDFIYRNDDVRGTPSLMMVSTRRPEDRDNLWLIETKPYQPRLSSGQLLGFSIRFNPVVSRRDDQGRQHRHDLVMDRKHQMQRDREPTIDQQAVISEVAEQWLGSRGERAGFSIRESALLAEGYRQHELYKRRGSPPIRFSTIDCQGLLTVTDPERFTDALFKGIGPAKSFGCGMMMVRRV